MMGGMTKRLSDEQLGRRLADGEAPAFDELYRRYAHRLAAYGTHLLGDGSAGDDVAQVALMRAYQALREGRVPESFGAWLYRVAHNVAIDSIRGRRELPQELQFEAAEEPRGSEAGALTLAIAALPERQRKVFVLRELHGLRISEAAGELGLSNAQVEQALFAARNRLAEQLVFGERLSCTAVQRLASGPLDTRERRALKTHVRSCPACRRDLGLRGVALSLPLPPLGWLRPAFGGGLAPVAAKVGTVAATAAFAVGIPIVVSHDHHPTLFAARAYGAPGPDTPLHLAANRPASSTAPVHRVARRHAPATPTHVVVTPVAPAPIIVPVSASATQTTTTAQPPQAAATAPAPQPAAQPVPSTPSTATPTPAAPASDPTTTSATTTTSSDGGGDTTTTDTTTDTTTTTSSDGSPDSSGDASGSTSDGSGSGTDSSTGSTSDG